VPAATFHFGVDDCTGYTVRLLRKAYRSGARVAVIGSAESLDRVDQLLWTSMALDFVPHARVKAGAPRSGVVQASPIVLCDRLDDASSWPVLVNLGDAWPDDPQRFERVLEIVSTNEAQVQRARERWKRYRELGFALDAHDAAATAGP
jgi:DNA polymerase-3 subunit chi